MAPALSSSSFRLAAAQPHYSKPGQHRSPRSYASVVFTKQGSGGNNGAPFPSFRLGGKKGSEAQDEGTEESGAQKKKPFFLDIDLGKLGEPAKSLVPAVKAPGAAGGRPSTALIFGSRSRKDPRTVFVAGAMGQAGVRIARALLRQGFSVRAGVPELAAAQELARIAAQYKIISTDESKRLNAVESAFGDAESIAKAIGNATKVVVTIGRGEDGPCGVVTTDDALQVVRAAQLAGVGHVTVVYDTSTSALPGDSTYNVLDGITSFFNNIFSRSQAPLTLGDFLKKVVEETEVSYTLIKASLGDDSVVAEGGSSGLVIAAEGTAPAAVGGMTSTSDYKASKSQIASLVADVFSTTSVAENKVVEVSRSPSVPSKSVQEFFSAIPEDGRRKAYQEAVAKAKAEEAALIASERARKAVEAAKKLSEQEARAASLVEEAKQKAEEAGSSLDSILTRAKGLSADFSWDKLSTQFAAAVAQQSEEDVPKAQVATVRGQAKARTLPPQKAVVKQPRAPKPKPKQPESRAKPRQVEQKAEVKKVFGGLFQQETIYVDDD